MSRSLGGNLLGAFIVVLGCLAGYGAYRISFDWGIVVGVGVALFGATIISPAVIHEGAKEFKESASGLVELIPLGRRSTDGVAVKVEPKKDDVKDDA